jgi:type VI secretion system protein VasG
MLRGTVPALENHHNVRILDEGVQATVRLSHRYLADRQLPDKAVSVLDTACARLALSQSATPPVVEHALRTLQDIETQTSVLERETAVGADHGERLAQLAASKAETQKGLEALNKRWDQERELVGKIRELRGRLEDTSKPRSTPSGRDRKRPCSQLLTFSHYEKSLRN